MSKTKKIVVVVSAVFLACVIGAGTIIGVYFNGKDFGHFYEIFGGRFDVDESIALDLNGVTKIKVDCTSTDIHIVQSDDAVAKLKGTVTSPKEQERYLDVYRNGNTLYINIGYEYPFLNFYNYFDLSVYLPESENLDMNVQCSSGDIDLTNLKLADLTLSSNSGSVKVNNCEAEKFSFGSSSGDTVIELSDFGSIDIESTSGNIDISSTSGDIDISSTSGDVTIDMAQHRIDPIKVYVSGGDVRLYLFSDTAFDLRAKVTSGNILSDLDIEDSDSFSEKFDENDISGKCNGGGVLVDLKTSTGNISILEK